MPKNPTDPYRRVAKMEAIAVIFLTFSIEVSFIEFKIFRYENCKRKANMTATRGSTKFNPLSDAGRNI